MKEGQRRTIRWGDETQATLERIARKRGCSVAEAVRWLAEEWERLR